MAASNDVGKILEPFHQRASEAEERLARLEAALTTKKDAENDDLLKLVRGLQAQIESLKVERALEKEQASKEIEKLRAENDKLNYRIIHLVRACQELKETK